MKQAPLPTLTQARLDAMVAILRQMEVMAPGSIDRISTAVERLRERRSRP